MEILEVNPISVKKRMTELLFDYLLIITYLGILFLCAITYYYIVFNGVPTIILSSLATLLAVLLLAMAIFRKDKRHLGDLLAHTQVQLEGDNK